MVEKISIQQARKLVLLSQGLPPAKKKGSSITATLEAIEHLGYIQIDTIAVIERAHHHTLWNRNPRYKTSQLDRLIAEKRVFEYWSHAASYLPMCDYRYSMPRKLSIASGEQNHWYKKDKKLMESVLQRITAEGPLMARDFDSTGERSGEWQTKPAKRALECLFMQGELMVSSRVNFQKVYDLTERVLPANVNTKPPDPEEYARFLIFKFLKANGLGQPDEITYLLKNTRKLVAEAIKEMVLSNEVLEINVGEIKYYALPASMELLRKPLRRSKLKILSPFDNLLIQRKRMQTLFDFNYLLECYVPGNKRKYGYFSLPVLWNGEFAARMDCKADKKKAILHIQHLALEPRLSKIDDFILALCKELTSFLTFNGCKTIKVHKTSPEHVHSQLQAEIDNRWD